MLDYSNAADSVTFLASFNGDLDTDICKGNGREMAKAPNDRRTRVVDTISLLGVLNDTQIDFDPRENDNNFNKMIPTASWNFFATDDPSGQLFGPLNPQNYWDNVTVRQGDLRAEGVWLGYPGASGKDATDQKVPIQGQLPDREQQRFDGVHVVQVKLDQHGSSRA